MLALTTKSVVSWSFRAQSHSAAASAVGRWPRGTTIRAASDTAFDGFSHEVAFCFPGQGAQYVGMCKEVTETVPKAKELFDSASEILG